MRPVPMRLRTPSTSVMMRETSAPTLVGVEVLQRQAADVLLHAAAQLGDEALGGLGERLREGEGGDALHDGGEQHDSDQGHQPVGVMLADDVIDQEFGGGGEHQPGDPVDDHENESQGEQAGGADG